jgi:hypothetical protein
LKRADITSKELKTSIFKYDNNYYLKMQCDDKYLNRLTDVFDDSPFWIECLMKRLLDPLSKGVTGNRIRVKKRENDKVYIEFIFADNPEESAIEIDRQILIDLINQWKDLLRKKPQEVIFTRHDDGTITIAGIFDEK